MKAKIEKLMVFLIPTDQVVGDFSQSMIKSDKLLENGLGTQGDIVEFVMGVSDTTQRGVKRVLREYIGQLWGRERGLHNKYNYTLKKTPLPPVAENVVSFL
jgi:hypothetical protein